MSSHYMIALLLIMSVPSRKADNVKGQSRDKFIPLSVVLGVCFGGDEAVVTIGVVVEGAFVVVVTEK